MKNSKQLLILLVLFGTFAWLNVQAKRALRYQDDEDWDNEEDKKQTDDYWASVKGSGFKFTGKLRNYYISADEVEWDYAPQGVDVITGLDWTPRAAEFTVNTATRIGSKYLKCLYREYTDDRFVSLKPRPASQEHMGFLGPLIQAEVGDRIRVVFRNKCSFNASIHPHGVFYDKHDEGARYNDTTPKIDKQEEIIQPGETHTYNWCVPERSGPGPMDGSSVMWMYYSHVHETADLYAGLIGPITITRKGMARENGSPNDVDFELFQLFSVTDEGQSPYLAQNWANNPLAPGAPIPTDGGFGASLQMHAINGWVFGNGVIPTIKQYERTRWYFVSMGSLDAHTPHQHGNTYLVGGMRMDVVSILPAEIQIADMCPDDVGIWLAHCHVGDHLDDGMVNRYEVIPNDRKTKCGVEDDEYHYFEDREEHC